MGATMADSAEYQKRYREENRGRLLSAKRAYYQAHKQEPVQGAMALV